jgi:hypothetical protein
MLETTLTIVDSTSPALKVAQAILLALRLTRSFHEANVFDATGIQRESIDMNIILALSELCYSSESKQAPRI